jgi:predicted small lipoprotein YifL
MLRTLLLVTLIAFTLAACGNKGALVMPDAQDKAQQDKAKDAAKKDAQPATTNQH